MDHVWYFLVLNKVLNANSYGLRLNGTLILSVVAVDILVSVTKTNNFAEEAINEVIYFSLFKMCSEVILVMEIGEKPYAYVSLELLD